MSKPKFIQDKKSGCLVWMGYTDKYGTGYMRVPGKNPTTIARAVYLQVHKVIPKNHRIRHTCNEPFSGRCGEPSHLQAVKIRCR